MTTVDIDPRLTAATVLADVNLQIAPDDDMVLFNGLHAHLADTRALEQNYIERHVNGASSAIKAARRSIPSASG